jgi:hypothetical protein
MTISVALSSEFTLSYPLTQLAIQRPCFDHLRSPTLIILMMVIVFIPVITIFAIA